MLVGRGPEQRAIEALAAGARLGRSGVLLLVGEAGVGKTALLDATAAAIGDMQLCRITGAEVERDLAFGGISQLVGAAPDELDRLPAPQARALGIALGRCTGADVDRLAVGAGTLAILSDRAESRPLAVLVDDAQWLDHASAEALSFAARRLLVDPILLLVAIRAGEDSPLLHAGLPRREIVGLEPPDARTLLVERTGAPVPMSRAERLVRATLGNPLALLELGDDPVGIDALGPEDPIAVRAALARAFLVRVERLPAQAQAGLLVAACAAGDPLVVADACRELGVDSVALRDAADAGLVRHAGTLEFQHPLVRAAIVGAATPDRLRAVHAALARATTADADRRARHLAAAAGGPDDDVAAALDQVAERARARAAHDVAASALERAAQLSTDAPARAARLVAAAESAWLAGQRERALALLRRFDGVGGDELVARAGHLLGTIAVRTGSVEEAIERFSRAADAVEARLPDAAIELWADTVNAAFLRTDTGALVAVRAALERLAPRAASPRARVLGDLAAGMAMTLIGEDGSARIRRSLEHLATGDTLRADPLRAEWLVLGPLCLREEGRFRELVHRALAETRESAALGELAHLLHLVALDDATTERWARADAEYGESIALARELGQSSDLALGLAGLAWLEARMGRERACREHADEALRISAEQGIVIGRVRSRLALGQLELGAGRPEQALVSFDAVDAVLRASGMHDMDLHPGSERVEALVRLGRADEAREAALEYHRSSLVTGQAWALARAERALGMVADDVEADAHFEAAAVLHETTPDRFEAARTALAHGASLRRRRRRRDARGLLRGALSTFDELGAAHRAAQAAVELAATGQTAHRRGASRLAVLTAQERQIAELLAAGRTTRQAAAALFLSPKTVEYHLRHVYAKLAVRSRSELAAALAEEQPDRPGPHG
ncbi:MAG: AAA family ATPase [Actinomycetota bacterium]